MSSKRSVEEISSGLGGGVSSKRPKQQAVGELDPKHACLLNPDDVPLARVMLFLDVPDIPAASRICKCWMSALQSVEDELWLGLVRRHRPSVERITKLLPDHVGKEEGTSSGNDGIPPPSRNWKRQFQRHAMIEKYDSPKVTDPKPLDSYFFEIQYEFWDKNDDDDDDGESSSDSSGRVSIVVEEPAVWDNSYHGENSIMIRFKRDDLGRYDNRQFDVCYKSVFRTCIRIFERSTGRQSILYKSQIMDGERFLRFGSEWGHHTFTNLVRRSRDDDHIGVRSNSSLLVNGGAENVEITIHFDVEIELDDDDLPINEQTTRLDQKQTLDILQNKIDWK